MGSGQVGRRSTGRRSREERRVQYLDAAAELLAERFRTARSDSAYALAHVRLTDVAARAGVSKGALYHIWPQQEAYWSDLLRAVFADMTPFGQSYGAWLTTIEGDDGIDATVGELFDKIFESRSTNPSVLTLMTLAAYRHDPSIHEAVHEQIRTMTRVYEPLIHAMLGAAGRVLREGIEPQTLVMVFRAVQDGFVFRHTYSPEMFTPMELGTQSVGVFSLVLEALMIHYSEPISDDPERVGADVDTGVDLGSFLSLRLTDEIITGLRSWREADVPEPTEPHDDVTSRYVRVGLELLGEFARREPNPLSLDGLNNLRINDVAAAVGVSKGSIYHIWSSQDAFRIDVLNHVLSKSNESSTQALNSTAKPAVPLERIRALSDLAFDLLKDDMRFYSRFGFTFMSAHPEVANILETAEIEIRENYVQLLFEALDDEGRRLRPSVDVGLLRLCVEAALYGTCLVYRSSPEMFDGYRRDRSDEVDTAASRFAEIVEAIWTHFSERVPA